MWNLHPSYMQPHRKTQWNWLYVQLKRECLLSKAAVPHEITSGQVVSRDDRFLPLHLEVYSFISLLSFLLSPRRLRIIILIVLFYLYSFILVVISTGQAIFGHVCTMYHGFICNSILFRNAPTGSSILSFTQFFELSPLLFFFLQCFSTNSFLFYFWVHFPYFASSFFEYSFLSLFFYQY